MESAHSPLHPSEKFVTERVHRSKLAFAEYNPRTLSDEARKRLKENLQRVGMLEPVIWNKRTGRLLGGHQRLKQLDAIAGNPDYELTVSVVDLDEQTEKEQNIFLNSPTSQGEWDFDKLELMFREDHINPDNAGFDPGDIVSMFGDDALIDQPEVMEELGTRIRELKERDAAIDEALAVNPDVDVGFYTIVVFPSQEARRTWTEQLGCGDEIWIDSKYLTSKQVTSCT
jgi:ParB-like chromosome segregation protein Spo0J